MYYIVYTLGSCFKNVALVYYCNYVLGTYNDGVTQMMVSVIGGIPMGIGILRYGLWQRNLAKEILQCGDLYFMRSAERFA